MSSHLVKNISEEDIQYEEEILRNAYSVKHWLRYIDHKSSASPFDLNIIFERAIKELPRSYKIWYRYLRTRLQQVRSKSIEDPENDYVIQCFEKSMVYMNKMPRIWLDFCSFMMDLGDITKTRLLFNKALRALPVTQHKRIWFLYIKFINKYNIPETGIRVYRRYLKLVPDDAEDFVEYLRSVKKLNNAAVELSKIVDNEKFVSKNGKSNHLLWNELCDLISKNPLEIKSVNVDAIIRSGLRRYTDQLGHLWNSLADYYVRSGLFERARDIYEEAIQTVTTVRDFTQIFDAYAQFEELSLNKQMEEFVNENNPSVDYDIDIELRLVRFENLMERRLLLLNSVLLRQNPHNVQEWHKRVELFQSQPLEIIKTYTEAVQTVQPELAVGKLHTLWVGFAKFYEVNGQLEDARVVFEKATQIDFLKVDELASVWCEWAEMEIRNNNIKNALHLMQKATVLPKRSVSYHDDKETVQSRLYKNLKLWSMYADLEESFGSFITCKAVYDRIIDLKICTPQIIINYALFLEEHNYFEDAFCTYEKGIALFKWPNVFEIWNSYITKFLDRYKGKKLERARDLFEQCLENCPASFAKFFYLLYAKLEEQHGLARHAMSVYERATTKVKQEEMFDMYLIYIKTAAEIYGLPRTRCIYEKAIENLPDDRSREMCVRFAEMETKLGEVDRARAIYAHCSQMCDPRITSEFWQTWKEFEIKHGNEDTMREMLRIKRSVQATYNTQVNMMAQMATNLMVNDVDNNEDAMKNLDKQQQQSIMSTNGANIFFVRGETQGGLKGKADQVVNPDEIDIDVDDDDDDEEEEDDGEVHCKIEKQIVPDQVFGSLSK
ncbi:XAB2 family protein [Megaselia abdita]